LQKHLNIIVMKYYIILITLTLVSFTYANFGYIPKEDPDLIIVLFLFSIISFSLLVMLGITDFLELRKKRKNKNRSF
jgi:hypothetical protein